MIPNKYIYRIHITTYLDKHEDKLIGIYQLDQEINGYVAGRIWNY